MKMSILENICAILSFRKSQFVIETHTKCSMVTLIHLSIKQNVLLFSTIAIVERNRV